MVRIGKSDAAVGMPRGLTGRKEKGLEDTMGGGCVWSRIEERSLWRCIKYEVSGFPETLLN